MRVSGKLLIGLALLLGAVSLPANERLKGIACRSVHLGYGVPEVPTFYVEMRVAQSQPGSYFCACAFDMGYFGLQEFADGSHHVIFSVWDPGAQNHPESVTPEQRVRLVYADPAVRVKRFGGEGTGGQSFYDFAWQTNTVYRFGVSAKVESNKTLYAALLFMPERNAWKHLATFQTLTGGKLIRNPYSFVEDFKRDRVSTTLTRKAYFPHVEGKTADGKIVRVTRARFTGDGNPVMNVDGGVDGQEFFLATGGDIQNTHTPIFKTIELPAAK